MDSKTISLLVENLNIEISEKINDDKILYEYDLYFEYRTTGFIDIVYFCNIQMWNSEDDERKYDEEKDEYEPLEDFLRRKVSEFCGTIEKISTKI